MKSPIKWVGGKASEIKHFEELIPEFKTYVEPFVGGGALFWHLQPEKAVLSDTNEYLINFYAHLKNNYDELISLNQNHKHTKEYYDEVVYKINNYIFSNTVENASIFYYINKTCFSGKWRVNSNGEFNNTWGNYESQNYKKLESIYRDIINNAELICGDYTEILEKYKYNSEAFIFLDPPYLDCDTMYTKLQKFESIYDYVYNYMLSCKCKVMMVVKNGDYIRELFKDFIVKEYGKKYCHNSKSEINHSHLVICNY